MCLSAPGHRVCDTSIKACPLPESTKRYTLEEVRKHNKEDDCWIIIDDGVYDVTKWADRHPGGKLCLTNLGGKDATEPYHGFHPESVGKTLKAFLVGRLDTQPSQLTQDFRDLRKQLVAAGLFVPQRRWFVLNAVRVFSLLIIAICLTLFNLNSKIMTSIGAALLGLFWQQLAFMGHDLGHNGVTHDRNTDRACGLLVGNMLNGISLGWWKTTHNVHHVVTNSIEADPDIQHMPVFAVTDRQFTVHGGTYSVYHFRWFPFDAATKFLLSYQHFLYYPIMALARFNLYAQSLIWMLKQPGRQLIQSKNTGKITELVGEVFYLTWLIALVCMLPTTADRVRYLLISHAVAGLLHVQITISHFSMGTYHGVRYDNDETGGWFRTQLDTTMDVDCPWWMDWFHGGLQYQVVHHLFPRLPRHNLRQVQPLVRSLAAKHNIPFQSAGFFAANCKTFNCLRTAAMAARKAPLGAASFEESLLWEGMNAAG